MPLLRDPEPLLGFLDAHRPGTNALYYQLRGMTGAAAQWVRVDDCANPRAVIVRTRRFSLFATDSRAAGRLVDELPRRFRMRFRATPTRLVRVIRQHWHGPDAGRRTWRNSCWLYFLKPGRLVIDRGHRVLRLRPADAELITRYWPYGRRARHIRERIEAGPAFGLSRRGELAAWALTHEDGSMGFLHVREEFRGLGMARTLTTAVATALLKLGIQPFMHIVKTNRASLSLTASMGFTRGGDYDWFGTD